MGNDPSSQIEKKYPKDQIFLYRGEIKGTKIEKTEETPRKKLTISPSKIRTTTGSLNSDIRKKYKFREVLGGGNFGSVRIAYRKNIEPQKYYAIKSISKKNLTEKDLKSLIKEVEIISNLHHPFICQFYETYQDKYYFHIVMELCTGNDLFSKIIKDGKISEHYVSEIIMKILKAITYCHSKQITHRDIKPENILFLNKENNSGIKLIDFGLSTKFNHQKKMHSILGTPYYIAPEVLKGNYDCKCDIWSIGAITYIMLCGSPIFNGKTNEEIFHKILYDEITFPKEKFDKISHDAIDFMKKCLIKNPDLRYSSKELLQHNWFKSNIELYHSEEFLDNEVLNNLKNYSSPIHFKKIILRYLINMVSENELQKLKQTFVAIDRDHTGFINLKELERAFQILNIKISNKDIQKIYEAASEQKGSIDYSQFLIASINVKKNLKKEHLIQAFEYFDIDDSGFIDKSDIQNALLRSGKKIICDNDIDDLLKEVKVNDHGKISLNEFLKLFGINE